jgi:RuvB-like protein 1 (pontin 52)
MSLKITTVASHTKQKKIASHTHLVGLGLDDEGRAEDISQGFVGQSEAREV